MLECVPPRYRLQDLAFALWGTVAFLVDLGSDVWSTVRYYKAGDTAWAVLYIGLYLLSSSVLQLLSWGWYWVDRQDWEQEPDKAAEPSTAATGDKAAHNCGDTDYAEECSTMPAPSDTGNGHMKLCSKAGTNRPERQLPSPDSQLSAVDALPITSSNPELGVRGAEPAATTRPPEPAVSHIAAPAVCPCCAGPGAASSEDELVMRRFCTSSLSLRPSCLTLLHLLQLGYPLRCIHSLEVGFAAYRNPKDDQFKDYAYFLTHDISMMRLMETFLENTPQLILVIYIIIEREAIESFQYVSISMSFICISWAILDYHQSLRLFLKGKYKLGILSSAIYYFWNFCLISSRILCITTFTVTLPWMIAVHFVFLWCALFLWTTLQKTTFMKHNCLENVYRATVAIILYFSWFNIADGRTLYRCVIYHFFITIDSILLIVTWAIFKSPSILDNYETPIIVTNIVFIAVGLVFRIIYYKCLHPNVLNETAECFDEPDGIKEVGANTKLLSRVKTGQKMNYRIAYLTAQIY
ncbi:XK-related protein 8 [Anomaloglossus baeobatrachus]|uniref:XK-related protein 8 n=1 Tax=Anomaloglossus baeobatrachus TaxID=238106 RepID=UPI003F501C77